MARRTAPPEGLNDRGRALWANCLTRDPALADSENPQRAVLHEAARVADRLDQLAAILDRDGPIITDSKGIQAPHPALKISLAAEALLARLIAALRMPDHAGGKRPQRRGAPRLQTVAPIPKAGTVSALERARRMAEGGAS